MGLSRNKVAVSEGAAGSPPFYGESVIGQTTRNVNDGRDKEEIKFVVQFSENKETFFELRKKSVLQTQRVHPFPFRTRKLSSAVVKILYGRLYGKIAQCRHLQIEGREIFPRNWRRTECVEHHTNHIGS